jgi:uncharacterized membrane protein
LRVFTPNREGMRFFFAALFAIVSAGPALANFSVCNRADHAARIALGRFNGIDWMSEGWWDVGAGKCQVLIEGQLKGRYYYLLTNDSSAGVWPGAHNFCVGAKESFRIYGRDNCAGRGYDRKGFYQIDTEQKLDYTTYISD